LKLRAEVFAQVYVGTAVPVAVVTPGFVPCPKIKTTLPLVTLPVDHPEPTPFPTVCVVVEEVLLLLADWTKVGRAAPPAITVVFGNTVVLGKIVVCPQREAHKRSGRRNVRRLTIIS
jgi:hypothetical protein